MPIATDGNGKYLTLDDSGQWVPATVAEHPETHQRMIRDGDKWVPEPRGTTSAGAFTRGVGQGLSFGFADELEAGKDALAQGARNLPGVGSTVLAFRRAMGWDNPEDHQTVKTLMEKELLGKDSMPSSSMADTYNRSLADSRADLHEDQTQHPVASTAGQIVGGVGGAVAGTLLAPEITLPAGLSRVGMAANTLWQPVATAVRAAPPAVQTGLRWAGTGAAMGGVTGFGEGEGGFGDRVSSAATGAATGAVVAPVLGTATAALAPWGNRLLMGLGMKSADPAAERQILRSFERSGRTVDDVADASTAAGDAPVTVMDLSGRPTVNLGATAANTPSTATQRAEEMVQARRAGRPERVAEASDAALGGGSGTDIAEATAQRIEQRRVDAEPLYRQAFSQPAGMTENMGHILNDPIAQQGLRRGREIQRIENASRRARGEPEVPMDDPAIQFNEQGDPVIVGVPNMRSLDAVKRGMDAILEDHRDPITGRINMTERLRAIDDMRRTWVGLLDANGDGSYGAARAAFAGPSAQMDATAAGRRALKTDRDLVASRVERMAPDEVDAYRLGVGRAVTDMVGDPGTAIGATRRLLEDRNMQARLGSVLGPDELARLNTVLRREVEMGNVEHTVNPRAGSQTGRLAAGGEDMRDIPGAWTQAIHLALQGRLGQAALSGLGDIYRTTVQGVNPRIANALGERLFVTDPIQRQALIEQLRRRQANDLANIWQAQRYGGAGLRGVAQVAGGAAGRP